MNRKIYCVLVAVIFMLSFRFYSALFYPILNSDHAVNILMIHDFKLPENLYFWGQDRIGSLIPLLGQPLFKGLHLSAITTESIVHYLILLGGFLAFSGFLKSRVLKIVLAIVWFFPPMRFIDLIELYSGIEYSFIAMACYLFRYLSEGKLRHKLILRHVVLSGITLLLLIAVWVSDMALITIVVLLVIQAFFFLKVNKFSLALLMRSEVFYAAVGMVSGYLFFHFAKAHATNQLDYATFSNFHSLIQAFGILWQSVYDLFSFNGDELFTSIYVWLLLLLFVIIAVRYKYFIANERMKKWLIFFILEALLVFVVIMVSKWTYLNGVPRRYFTCTYISLSIALLIVLDNADTRMKNIRFIKGMLLTTVILGGIGTIYNLKYFWPRTLTPKVEIVAEFKSLGQIGIIAEYWNSYIVACPDPENIKATPHDGDYVRNPEMVEAVFRQKNIYIIRDMWLKSFPDSLEQFNRLLVKDGEAFSIGDCEVCKYRKTE